MISKIISRAASLAELTSNPKSFSNCPDLHGGVPGLFGGEICMEPAVGKKRSSRRQLQCLWPKIRLPKRNRTKRIRQFEGKAAADLVAKRDQPVTPPVQNQSGDS
jgi:hypothetical protein